MGNEEIAYLKQRFTWAYYINIAHLGTRINYLNSQITFCK